MSDPEPDSPALPGLFGVAGLPALPSAPVRRARKAPGGPSASAVQGAPRPVGGEGGAAAPPLGKRRSKVDAPPRQDCEPEGPEPADSGNRRSRRFWVQRQAALILPEHKGLSGCLRKPQGSATVSVVKGEGGAGFRGLQRCSSPWVCPCCGPRIAAKRTSDIEDAIRRHQESHPEGVVMLTLTTQHHGRESLARVLDGLLAAVKRLRQSRQWRTLKPMIEGTIRTLEVNASAENGWHPHLHMLIFGRCTRWQLERALQPLRAAWLAALKAEGRRGGRAAFEVSTGPALARYLTKLASEAAGHTTKKARAHGGRTGWQLLEDAVAGDCDAIDLWRDYALTTRGKAWIVWSHGLRARLGMGAEATDKEIAEAEAGGDTIATLMPEQWQAVVRAEMRGRLLDAADADGEAGVWRVVREAMERPADRRRRPPPL